MLKVITLVLAISLCPIYANPIHIEEVQALYNKALFKAGGIKDFYSIREIKAFNETFLPLIKRDQFPGDVNYLIPGTKPRFVLDFLNRLNPSIECRESQAEAAPLIQEDKELFLNLQTNTSPESDLETEPLLGDVWQETIAPTPSLRDHFSKKYIECDDCPEYVGAVQLFEPDMLVSQQCSGSLVDFAGKTYFYTNRHCIPADMKKEFREGNRNVSCSQRIAVTFAKIKSKNLPNEKVNCKKIVAISEEPLTGEGPPDWAIIELGPTTRAPAKMLTRDIVRDEKITLFPMYNDRKNQGLNPPEKRLDQNGVEQWYSIVDSKKVQCQQLRAMNLIGSRNCDQDLTSGNSGSGAFNKNQRFSGVLSHIVPIELSQDEYALMVAEGKKLWAPAFIGTTSRDILKEIYVHSQEDEKFRPFPMEDLDEVFPKLKNRL